MAASRSIGASRARWFVLRPLLAWILAAIALITTAALTLADDPLRARVTGIENRFPNEVVFSVEAESNAADVRSIDVRLAFGNGRTERFGSVKVTPGRRVEGKFTLKSGGSNFIPAGTDMAYWLELEDTAGNRLRTEKQRFWYADTRFDWRKVDDGRTTVYYHGGVESNARSLLGVARDTEERAGRMLGTTGRPFTLMLYNSARDITGAQQPEGSETRRRELIRAGIAYPGEDLVQVLGGGSGGGAGTARHEITHLFVHWTAGSNVPAWLDEGLAVWGQTSPGSSYQGALDRAIRDDKLLLLRGMDAFPGRSDETILAYGQSYSVVKYLIDAYGGDKLRDVYVGIRSGESAAQAIKRVHDLTLDELDAEWRRSVGARPRATYESVMPTPVALAEIPPIDSNAPGTAPESAAPATRRPPFAAAVTVALVLLTGTAAVFAFLRRRS